MNEGTVKMVGHFQVMFMARVTSKNCNCHSRRKAGGTSLQWAEMFKLHHRSVQCQPVRCQSKYRQKVTSMTKSCINRKRCSSSWHTGKHNDSLLLQDKPRSNRGHKVLQKTVWRLRSSLPFPTNAHHATRPYSLPRGEGGNGCRWEGLLQPYRGFRPVTLR